MGDWAIRGGDAEHVVSQMVDGSVNAVVTSPPYWRQRRYTDDPKEMGWEPNLGLWLNRQVAVFREVRRVLHSRGVMWLNCGDSSARVGASLDISGRRLLRPRERCMAPARLALALQADGWLLVDEVVWHRPNPIPEPVNGRTVRSHEMLYLFAKQDDYAFDGDAIREPHADPERGRNPVETRATVVAPAGDTVSGRNTIFRGMDRGGAKRVYDPRGRRRHSVWSISSQMEGKHFSTFPLRLAELCVMSACPVGGTVLDPYCGSATTGVAAVRAGRNFRGIELVFATLQRASERLTAVSEEMRVLRAGVLDPAG